MRKHNQTCPLIKAAELIADAGTVLIIKKLLEGPARFSELQEYVCLISEATLSSRLKHLAEHGLIERKSYDEIPPKVEYSLTPKAAGLGKVVSALKEFGKTLQ